MFRITLVISLFLITKLHAQDLDNTKLEKRYLEAVNLFENNKFKAASLHFDFLKTSATQTNLKINSYYYNALCAIYSNKPEGEALMKNFVLTYPDHPRALLAYFDLGNYYFENKKYKIASIYFNKVEIQTLSEAQKNDFYFRKGFSDYNLKKHEEALENLNIAKRRASQYQHQAAYYAGFIAYQNKDYDNALIDMKLALEHEDYSKEVPYIIASIYYSQNRLEDLEIFSEKYLESKKTKRKSEISLMLAELYFNKSDFKNANKYYSLSNKNSRSLSSAVKYRIAYTAYKVKELETAKTFFKDLAVKKDSIGIISSYYLGNIYLQEENKQYAKTAFEQVKNSNTESDIKEESAFLCAKINFDLGNYQQAILAATDFLKKYPESTKEQETKEYIAKSYLNTNDYRSAIRYLENSKLKTEELRLAYQTLAFRYGVSLFNKGKFKHAILAFRKASRFPEDRKVAVEVKLWTAEAYSVLKEYEASKAFYLEVLRDSYTPKNLNLKADYGLAYAYYYDNRFDLALPYFKTYVEALSDASNKMNYDDALMRLADCYYVNKTYSYAERYYDLVIEQENPDKDYAFFQKGMISGIESKVPKMRYAFEQVLSFQPRSSYYDDALFQMAKFNADAGNYKLSAENLSRLMSESAESALMPFALEDRATANFNLKNYASVIDDYAKILSDYPSASNAKNALLSLQEALALAGRNQELAKYMELYKQSNPDDNHVEKVAFEASKQYYYSQKYEKSVHAFSNFLIEYSSSTFAIEAKYFLGDSYYRVEDNENAIKWFDEVISDGKSIFVNRALTKVLLLQASTSNYRKIIENSKLLEKRARNKKDLYKAWSAMMKAYYHLEKQDSVSFYSNLILEKANVSTNSQNLANLYLAKASYAKGDNQEAMDLFLQTINSAKDVNGAEAQYLLAELFYKEKQHEQSISTLMDLSKDFSSYEYWLTKAFILIAQNYIEMGETFQAKATLESVIDKSPVEVLVKEAKEILIRLEQKVQKDEGLEQTDSLGSKSSTVLQDSLSVEGDKK